MYIFEINPLSVASFAIIFSHGISIDSPSFICDTSNLCLPFFSPWLAWLEILKMIYLFLAVSGFVAGGLGCLLVCGIFSSSTRDQTHIPCTGRWILNNWITREVPSLRILSILLIFSKNQFLVWLISCIVLLFSISLTSALLFIISFLLLA